MVAKNSQNNVLMDYLNYISTTYKLRNEVFIV